MYCLGVYKFGVFKCGSASRYLVFKLDAMESQMMERVQFTVLLSDPPMIPAAKGVCFVLPDVNFTCCSPVRND